MFHELVIIDGDQPLSQMIDATTQYVNPLSHKCDIELIRMQNFKEKIPRILKRFPYKVVLLKGFSPGKEVTDKFIAMRCQQALREGYSKITVISNDYDFIDIFKMLNVLNNTNVKFTLVAPKASGRLSKTNNKQNISISFV